MGAPHPDARQAIILVCAAAFLWMLAVPADGASYIHLGLGLGSKPPAAVDAGPVVAPVPASAASPPLPRRRRRRRLDEEYRAAGLRLAPDPMFWSHTAVSDWTAEDLGLPWCAQLFRTLEIDGPKLLGLLGVATPYGHAKEGSSQPNSGSGRAAVEALDTAGLATFLAEHEGRTVQFDHGMGVKPTPLPRRKGKDLRSTVAQQADQVAAGVARALRACVLNSSTCPSSATFPVAPSIREHAEAETARQASLVSAADPLPVFAPDSVMEQRQPGARGWPHGTCAGPVQAAGGLRFGSDPQLAQRICCHNRHNAEHRWYFRRTAWSDSMSRPPTPPALSTPDGVGDDGTVPARQDTAAALNYYDVVTGKRMFVAPRGRSAEAFYRESLAHGWPSFRDEEVDWANVRSLRNGEMVSLDGTHLGHNIPDHHGNRYCINLVCVSGHAAPQPPPQPVPLAVLARGGAADTRVRGMLWGLFTGNALGMPSMWFYRPPGQIVEAFGPTGITGFVAPPARHPGSIMSAFWNSDREHVRDVVGKVILHGRESVWQTPGSHYHSGLRAGDNTLNARLVEVLMQSLSRAACAGDPRGGQQRDSGSSGLPNPGDSIGYDPDAYLAAYIRFMMTPGMHEDSYADTAHIQFFYKYSQGKSPRECVGVENHSTGNIGSTVGLPVLMAATAGAGRAGATAGDGDMTPASFATAEQAVVQHVGLTHRSARLMAHVRVMCRLFARLLRGVALRAAVRLAGADLGIDFDRLLADATARQRPHRRPPSPTAPTSTAEVEGGGTQGSSAAGRLPSEPFVDLPVVTQAFGLACYIHDALPTTLYLAFKYHEPAQAAAGLLANANLGGNTADRGAILGAILGAAHGPAVLRDWSSQLARRAALQESIDSFVGALSLARSDSLVTADRDRL